MNDSYKFFDHLGNFEHQAIFKNIEYLWDPLKSLKGFLERALDDIFAGDRWTGELDGTSAQRFSAREGQYRESCLLVNQWAQVVIPVFFEQLGIYIDQDTILEPTAIIKGPAIIGKHCEIRQGAYIRGNALVGDHCIIGHATELKNTIMMNHTEAGHFNYIGDSILGSYVNLGAGSRLANLQFRTVEEKEQQFIQPVKIKLAETEVDTGLEKFGAVLGDCVELGCNTVTCPGVVIGKNSWVYPNTTLQKGFYQADTFFGPKDRTIHSWDK